MQSLINVCTFETCKIMDGKRVEIMADKKMAKQIAWQALDVRINILNIALRHKIHIGGDLSVADVMAAIWHYMMKYDAKNAKWEGRDRFILSKGHGAAVTSLNQAAIGCYTYEEVIQEYATDFGRFGMHSCNLRNPHVEVSTGSLGHGLPVSTGIAQGLRLKGNTTSRVYTVVGDGEAEEGSVWEAISYAKTLGLGNLICFVDCNGLQCTGPINDVSSIAPIEEKFKVFGWNVAEVDGHDIMQLMDLYDHLPDTDSDIPTAVIAHTVKGKGISYMENCTSWHNGMVTQEQYSQAVDELRAEFKRKWGKCDE